MHYAIHRRERFAEWVNDGCPAVAVIQMNDGEHEVSARVMLRRMRRCTDLLPSALGQTISDQLGDKQSLRGRTYGEAARRLLAATASATP